MEKQNPLLFASEKQVLFSHVILDKKTHDIQVYDPVEEGAREEGFSCLSDAHDSFCAARKKTKGRQTLYFL